MKKKTYLSVLALFILLALTFYLKQELPRKVEIIFSNLDSKSTQTKNKNNPSRHSIAGDETIKKPAQSSNQDICQKLLSLNKAQAISLFFDNKPYSTEVIWVNTFYISPEGVIRIIRELDGKTQFMQEDSDGFPWPYRDQTISWKKFISGHKLDGVQKLERLESSDQSSGMTIHTEDNIVTQVEIQKNEKTFNCKQ